MSEVGVLAPRSMARMATHIPLLVRVFDHSEGDVLEMGTGYFSTLLLRWLCEMFDRQLWSYESNLKWAQRQMEKPKPFHHVIHALDFDKADIVRPWGLAFIDHGPNTRRIVDIKRLANSAKYLVIHDTQPRHGDPSLPTDYNYEEVWPLFKNRYDYTKVLPWTSVVSNFDELRWLR